MQNNIIIQIIFIHLLLINSSIEDKQINSKFNNDNSELNKINRINRINKKLNLIEESVINQNQLIDALEQDTFSPHQTVTLNLNSDIKTATTKLNNNKDNEDNLKYSTLIDKSIDFDFKEGDEESNLDNKLKSRNNLITNIENDNINDYLHFNLHRYHHLNNIESTNLHHYIISKKQTQKKKSPKLINNEFEQTATFAMPYSTTTQSPPIESTTNSYQQKQQTLSNSLNKDTTKYTINTYSAVSFNPPHYHLQYKQINIKPNNQTILLNTLLPSTFSFDRLITSTTKSNNKINTSVNNDKLTKFLNLINKAETDNLKLELINNKDDNPNTTPISIDLNTNNLLFDKSKRTSRHTKQDHNHFLSDNNDFLNHQNNFIYKSSLDKLQHHQLSRLAFNFDPRNLLVDNKGQNKAKNQIELRLNSTETIKVSWPIKKAVDLVGDINLGGLMMVHERDENYVCGAIMPQGGIQALECMLYTIDWINNQTDFLPGMRLGAFILDDCDRDTYGLEMSIDFIKGSISNINDENYLCKDGSSPVIKQNPIAGVLGAASSMTST